MATYQGEQFNQAGLPTEQLVNSSTHTFTFTNVTGSSYFTLETLRNSDGFYDSSSPKYALGAFTNESGVTTHISSSYIFSYVVEEEGASFEFQPTITIPVSGSMLRGTGNMTLTIS